MDQGIRKPDIEAVVDGLFKKWTPRLRLQDWEICWRIVRKGILPENKSGQCETMVPKKIARISILHPADADENWLNKYDFELTIVHELLHLHLGPWQLLYEVGDHAELFLEQAVHCLSKSLVEADRQEGSWKLLSQK